MIYLKVVKRTTKKLIGSVSDMRQQENEMKLKLAMELQELTELSWELLEDLEKAKQAGDEKEIDRYTRWKSKTIARIETNKENSGHII